MIHISMVFKWILIYQLVPRSEFDVQTGFQRNPIILKIFMKSLEKILARKFLKNAQNQKRTRYNI